MRIWPEKTVDQEFADLGTAGWSGTLNDRQFAYLRDAGYTGGLADMMFQLRVSPPSGDEAPVITGVPTISGTATVGNVLTASPASVTGTPSPTRTWQWRRDGVDIGGATASTYTLVAADYGVTITVRQTETNVAGTANATSAGTAIPWAPAALFQASEGGLWGTVRTSDLWQDTARTTPVTAAGQSVASWRLYTASGVVYAEQATGTSQPTYQTDANGVPYLNFDGTNDGLVISTLDMSASDELTLVIAHRRIRATTTASSMIELTSDGASNNGGFYVRAPWSSPYVAVARGTTSNQLNTSDSAAPISNVLTVLADISAPSLATRLNGAAAASNTSSMGTGNFANAIFTIGRRNNADLPFQGWVYGLIFRGALTSGASLTSAEAWADAFINP